MPFRIVCFILLLLSLRLMKSIDSDAQTCADMAMFRDWSLDNERTKRRVKFKVEEVTCRVSETTLTYKYMPRTL